MSYKYHQYFDKEETHLKRDKNKNPNLGVRVRIIFGPRDHVDIFSIGIHLSLIGDFSSVDFVFVFVLLLLHVHLSLSPSLRLSLWGSGLRRSEDVCYAIRRAILTRAPFSLCHVTCTCFYSELCWKIIVI